MSSVSRRQSLYVKNLVRLLDGLSKLPPIRLISERDEEELQTAKPTFTDKGELISQSPDATDDAQGVNEPEPAFQSSNTSPSPQQLPTTQSTKTKSPPPPLLLDSPASELPPPPPEAMKEPTPVSGDVLLPLIIYSVVKANPPHLVSNLLFIQRFRNQAVGGEESYCLINLLAVAEFLENVDMAGLGLGDSDKVMSTADLTPIPLARSPVTAETPLEPVDQGLRGRVGQQVDAITDSANKVITGVVDSSFGILRSLMPAAGPSTTGSTSAPGTPVLGNLRPGFGLLRRESGFSIASLAASLPITGRSRSNTATEEAGQQLLTVSRPSSVRSRVSARSLKNQKEDEDSGDDESESVDESSATGDEEEEGEDDGDEEDEEDEAPVVSDARSIRSFESMLSASKGKSKNTRSRKSLSDRLASVSAFASLKVRGHIASSKFYSLRFHRAL